MGEGVWRGRDIEGVNLRIGCWRVMSMGMLVRVRGGDFRKEMEKWLC